MPPTTRKSAKAAEEAKSAHTDKAAEAPSTPVTKKTQANVTSFNTANGSSRPIRTTKPGPVKRNWFQLKKYQFEVSIGTYMLEPWERRLFNFLLLCLLTAMLYVAVGWVPGWSERQQRAQEVAVAWVQRQWQALRS
eukprot:comp18580_c0_seq1/m.20081 comp18580_c0_seq1/g.20081  ORF comp18580_c0_seq1/g.20081 comp18580_c0_seq1/m.20081 type:complete len:136 (-) comp18580_c0_seq1:105-512(-)